MNSRSVSVVQYYRRLHVQSAILFDGLCNNSFDLFGVCDICLDKDSPAAPFSNHFMRREISSHALRP